jgi:hypothetical protein
MRCGLKSDGDGGELVKRAKNERDAYMLRGNLLLDTGVICHPN